MLICRGDARCCAIRRNQQIAECLGFNDAIDQTHVRDLVIVGAGPAGLAAAVYGASEGLDVLVLEVERAGRPGRLELDASRTTSGSRPAFPGQDLDGRARTPRPQKFGAQIIIAEGRDGARVRRQRVRRADRRRRRRYLRAR